MFPEVELFEDELSEEVCPEDELLEDELPEDELLPDPRFPFITIPPLK